jgi:ribonuclease III
VFLFNSQENNTLIYDKRAFRARLKCLLGFIPSNLRLYEMAFIHRSASCRLPDGTRVNNERLEYLGDAILDTILSEYLFHKYPDTSEGFLTKTRAKIVNREQLNQLALSLGFEEIVVSHLTSPNPTYNLYGDALEALVGALFIDRGYNKTRKFFISHVLEKHLNLNQVLESETDYKSLILEWGQKQKQIVAFECTEETDGNTHKSVFNVSLLVNDVICGTGRGNSKKEAEQDASMKAWTTLNSNSKE